jgi:hypothetical protein
MTILINKIILRSIYPFLITAGISVIFGGLIPLITLEKNLGLDWESYVMLFPSFFFSGGLGILFIVSQYQRKETYMKSLKMSNTSTTTSKEISS